MRKFEKIAVSSTAMTGKIVALVAVFALIFGIVSCKNNVDEPEKPVYYTITFDSDGGSSVEAQNVENGKTAEKPTDPTKAGYDFGGWYNGASVFNFTKPVTEKITLKAKWTLHTFTITYNLDGGTNASENPATYTIEDEITLKNAEKTGRTFSGWFNENTKVTKIAKGTTGNITLTAKWDLATYDVTLNVNGGTIAQEKDVKTYTYGTTVTLPTADDITRTGYKFEGWFTSNNNGTALTGDAVTEITATDTGNKVFYAKWTECTYTVTLNANGGTITEGKNVTTYTYGTAATLPTASDITRSGYKFCGWFISNDDRTTLTSDVVTEITATDTGNKVFYAKWLEIYTITYNGVESGMTNPNPANYTIEDEITLKPVEVEKKGYRFAWYDAVEGGNVITKIAKDSTGEKTLWARWTIITYTITYDKNCTEDVLPGPFDDPENYTVETDTITLSESMARLGCSLEGWYDAATGGNKVTKIEKGSIGDITLYAHWTLRNFTITYSGLPEGLENSASNPSTFTVNDLPLRLERITSGNKVYYWQFDVTFFNEVLESGGVSYSTQTRKDVIPVGSTTDINATAIEVDLANITLKAGWQINEIFGDWQLKAKAATSFRRSDTEPVVATYYLDTAGSFVPVWYDSETKTIWYYIMDGANLRLSDNSSNMFNQMSLLNYIELSDFNTSNVTNMSKMFNGCNKLTELDLSSFNIENVTNISSMFALCRNLTTIYVAAGTDWSGLTLLTNSNNMFDSCSKLTGGAGTKFDSTKHDKTYARVDGGTDSPGYFTVKE